MNYRIEIGSLGLLEGNGEMLEVLLVAVADREKIEGRTGKKPKGRVQKGDAADEVEMQFEDRMLDGAKKREARRK